MKRTGFRRFLGYACVGAAGTSVQYAVLTALVWSRMSGAVAASCLGAIAGAIVNYILNYRVTFRATGPHSRTAPRFLMIAVAGIAVNSTLMLVLTRQLSLSWLSAQCFATACVLLLTYTASSLWTFGGRCT